MIERQLGSAPILPETPVRAGATLPLQALFRFRAGVDAGPTITIRSTTAIRTLVDSPTAIAHGEISTTSCEISWLWALKNLSSEFPARHLVASVSDSFQQQG